MLKRILRPLFLPATTLLMIGVYFIAAPARHETPAKPAAVLVELFTSEGCSDCPPADDVLAKLQRQEMLSGVDVITMSEHVDYWNRLGWSDPFSDAQFSSRQNEYAHAFGSNDIYTPQMVVDGEVEFIGSNSKEAVAAVTHAAAKPKAAIEIIQTGRDSDGVRFQISMPEMAASSPKEAADVFLAITENNLDSNVERGENRGRRLTHVSVVRKLITIGKIGKGSFTATSVVRIARQWKVKDLSAIAFVQEKKSRHILAVSSTPIELASPHGINILR